MNARAKPPVFWPREVILGLTSRCNFRCSTCGLHRRDAPGRSDASASYQDMPDEILFKLEDVLRHARTVTMGGVGEPLIARDFIRRIHWVRELNPRVRVAVFTNGSALINLGAVEEVAGTIDYLHVSCNGLESYEAVTGGGKWQAMLRSLELLRDARRRRGRPQRVELGVLLMRSNLDDLVPLAKLARDLEFDRVAFKDLWVFDEGMKSESLRHDAALAEAIREQVRRAREVGVPVRCEPWPELSTPILRPAHVLRCAAGTLGAWHRWPKPAVIDYWLGLMMDRIDSRSDGDNRWGNGHAHSGPPPCSRPWDTVQIDERGEVLLCCDGATRVGQIRDKSFLEVWTGAAAAAYRAGLLTGGLFEACQDCKRVNPRSTSFVRVNG